MCLAYLFKRLHEENLSSSLDLRAFIIDHKARHDSTAEAHGVASLLHRMGASIRKFRMTVQLTVHSRSQVRNPYDAVAGERTISILT
jgi:tRNA(Ile)-lysidine synthase TilS/MesJ